MKIALVHSFPSDFSTPGSITWDDAPTPEPAAGQVLIKVLAAATNPIDYKIGLGSYKAFGTETPHNPMSDFAGVVEKAGPDVDMVIGTGVMFNTRMKVGLAEFIVMDAAVVGLTPAGWSATKAASVPMTLQTANECVKGAGPLTSESRVVLIGASGGVGSMVLQLLRETGAKVFAVCGTKNVDFVTRIGGGNVEVVDYKVESWLDRFGADKGAPDAVIDCSAAPPDRTFHAASQLEGMGKGSYVTTNWIDASFTTPDPPEFHEKAKLDHAEGRAPSYTVVNYGNSQPESRALFSKIQDWEIPVVTVFPKDKLHEAFGMMMGHGGGKAVIDMA